MWRLRPWESDSTIEATFIFISFTKNVTFSFGWCSVWLILDWTVQILYYICRLLQGVRTQWSISKSRIFWLPACQMEKEQCPPAAELLAGVGVQGFIAACLLHARMARELPAERVPRPSAASTGLSVDPDSVKGPIMAFIPLCSLWPWTALTLRFPSCLRRKIPSLSSLPHSRNSQSFFI